MSATAIPPEYIRADILSQYSRFTALHRRFLDGSPPTTPQQPPPLLWHATHFDPLQDQSSVMPASVVVLSYHHNSLHHQPHVATPVPDLEAIDVIVQIPEYRDENRVPTGTQGNVDGLMIKDMAPHACSTQP